MGSSAAPSHRKGNTLARRGGRERYFNNSILELECGHKDSPIRAQIPPFWLSFLSYQWKVFHVEHFVPRESIFHTDTRQKCSTWNNLIRFCVSQLKNLA